MTQKELSQAKDSDLFFALDAMKRAALAARKLAVQTNTAIVVYENGKIVRRTALQLQDEAEFNAIEVAGFSPQSK